MTCQGAAAAGPRSGSHLRAAIDRLDRKPVIGLADQLLERRAFQHAIDQLAPVVIGLPAQNRLPSADRQFRGHSAGRSAVDVHGSEIATGRPPSQTVVLARSVSRTGQPLNSLGGQPGQRCRDAAAARSRGRARSPAKRHQHESAFEQARVRQRQFRFLHRHIVIGDQVEVEGARSPASFVGAIAAEFLFRFCAA